jgi:hypothetical protein
VAEVTLIARSIPASALVIDLSTKLTLATATAIRALAPEVAVGRYVFFGPSKHDDLDAAELQMLLGLKFIVFCIRHVPNSGWHADAITGLQHAQAGVANAIKAGYVTPRDSPHPISMTTDSEGVANPGPAMVDYERSSFQVATQHNDQNIGYDGFDCGLRGLDLDAFNQDASCGGDMTEWWCDFASLSQRPTPAKGYALHQKAQTTLCGVGVDKNIVIRDGAIWGLYDGDVNVETTEPAAGNS